MKVSIAYADSQQNLWQPVEVESEATIEDVIKQSGIIEEYALDISQHKVGIFGKFAKLSQTVNEGDRIEIYNPITRKLDEDDDDDDD